MQRVLIIYLVNHGVKVPRSLQLLIEYLIQMRLARLEGGYDITKHSRSLNVAYPSIWSLGDMVSQTENSKDYLSTHKSNKIAIIQFYFFSSSKHHFTTGSLLPLRYVIENITIYF